MDVGLELGNRLDRESMRDDLALAGVLSAVARVEQTPLDTDKGIVEVPKGVLVLHAIPYCAKRNPRFQETIAMAINGLDSIIVEDADMVWLDTHDWAKLLVQLVNRFIPIPPPTD